jgi:hypothetical protein
VITYNTGFCSVVTLFWDTVYIYTQVLLVQQVRNYLSSSQCRSVENRSAGHLYIAAVKRNIYTACNGFGLFT